MAISGTHTHASPAGFLQYVLYDITSLGFVRQSFTPLVEGIVQVGGGGVCGVQPGGMCLQPCAAGKAPGCPGPWQRHCKAR